MPEHRVESWNLLLCPYREEGRVSYVIDLQEGAPSDQPAKDRHPYYVQRRQT
jgi:hypothetical protein